MEKTDKAEIIFYLGMYLFMLSTAGVVAYEFIKLSRILVHIILSH